MANGLCHGCYSSNELITLDKQGLPKCGKCHDREVTKCESK